MVEKAKTNSVVTATWAESVLTLAVKGAGDIVVNIDELSPMIIERAAKHGLEQRLRDRAAIARDTKTGASASAQEKFERIKSLADHYLAGGEWEMRGEGGVRRKETDYILQALADIQAVAIEVMVERVAAQAEKRGITPDAYLKAVATSPAVATKVAEIKFGEANGAEDMLAELDEVDDEPARGDRGDQ